MVYLKWLGVILMNELKELFLENKKYTFKEIKKILNIDEETLYNQLQFLEEQGIIIESNGTFQKIPNNCVVSKIKICKNGCGVFYLDKDKYQIHPNEKLSLLLDILGHLQ